ncbi:MAG: hypothetical protein LBT55_02560 [Clostridiaceae bacterium]|jgi:hypothetical protein|nr:hypothetical protein [Clostridiaceae bacterium]
MKTERKKKTYADDDGRVLYDMNLEGFKWYDKAIDSDPRTPKTSAKNATPPPPRPYDGQVSKKERRALILAAYRAYLPMLASIVAGFIIVMFIIKWWLS